MVAALWFWMKIGVLWVDRMEEDGRAEFFIKSEATWKFFFSDSDRSDASGEERDYRRRMDEKGDWLPGTKEFVDHLTYCRYRYGIAGTEPAMAMTKCKDRENR